LWRIMMTASSATLDPIVVQAVENELTAVEATISSPPDLDQVQRMLPQANGDQDTW
jgi:hypothetical protein